MVSLNVIVVIQFKWALHFFMMQILTSHISHMPFKQPLLQGQSPFQAFFGQPPNYLKLKNFGCVCYPFTWPYNSNKM